MENRQDNVREFSQKDLKVLGTLFGLIAMMMAFATLTVQKVIQVNGLILPASTIWFLLITFPVMQIICANYGKKIANIAVFVGWVSMAVTTVMAHTLVVLPPAPVFEARNEIFNSLMSGSLRYFLAASFAYIVTHMLGNEYFSRLKFTKHLWIKSTVTSICFVLVNTFTFTFAMFTGAMPFGNVVSIFFGTYVFRFCLIPVITILFCIGHGIVYRVVNGKRQPKVAEVGRGKRAKVVSPHLR